MLARNNAPAHPRSCGGLERAERAGLWYYRTPMAIELLATSRTSDTTVAPRWIVAFSGWRDHYQVPLALQEVGWLDRLVTDFYAPNLGWLDRSSLGRFRHRRVEGLPLRRVVPTPVVPLHRLRMMRASPWKRAELWRTIDASISRLAGRRALASGADVLLYKGYAREAFAMPGLEDRAKGLFVYHPHGDAAREILDRDAALYPEIAASHAVHRAEIELLDSTRFDDELSLSDFVVCTSAFTARTLPRNFLHGRAPLIAPYGVFASPPTPPSASKSGPCTFLFVGQGVQRKGLHHLLRVWKELRLSGPRLVVVTSELDRGLENRVSDGVTVLGRLPPGELDAWFRRADVFVMPSLVEGYGLVYLEALAAGCFTIGTRNTGLPDLELPDWAANVIDAGDLTALADALVTAADLHRRGELAASDIAGLVSKATWRGFRERIREICATWDTAPLDDQPGQLTADSLLDQGFS